MKNHATYKKRLLGSRVLTKKTASKVILKQYKESLSIERKRGSKRKKGFAKASKILHIFLKNPNRSGRKVAQKVGFY